MRNDYTVRFDGGLYQIEHRAIVSRLRGAAVRVEKRLDDAESRLKLTFPFPDLELAKMLRDRGYGVTTPNGEPIPGRFVWGTEPSSFEGRAPRYEPGGVVRVDEDVLTFHRRVRETIACLGGRVPRANEDLGYSMTSNLLLRQTVLEALDGALLTQPVAPAPSYGVTLLERVKFLAIFGSNMDEFFMVRVSNLRRKVEAEVLGLSIDGMTPRELLAATRKFSLELDETANRCLQRKLLPNLEKAGIHLLDYDKLTKVQKEKADAYFQEVVHPVLTPLALDVGHPFPHISNLSLNLAIIIRDPRGNEKIARLKVPGTLPRLVPKARPTWR